MYMLIQKKNPFWYFDATGNILTKILRQNQPFLYSITVNDSENKIIIPISEFITTRHDSLSISKYLLSIKNTFENYAKHSSEKPILFPFAPIIITDHSWALINSILFTFNNNCSIESYLHKLTNLLNI